MIHECFDVFPADVFEEIKARGVEEIVAGHGVEKDFENGYEKVVLNHLADMMFIVKVEDGSEVFDCG